MTFEEWRQTRVWYDELPGSIEPGFLYIDNSRVPYNLGTFDTEDGSFDGLKSAEYNLWNTKVKFSFDTQQDECTICWSETTRYSCTAPLTRGLDDEDAFDEMQELLTLDNDVEKEEIGTDDAVIGEVTWQ